MAKTKPAKATKKTLEEKEVEKRAKDDPLVKGYEINIDGYVVPCFEDKATSGSEFFKTIEEGCEVRTNLRKKVTAEKSFEDIFNLYCEKVARSKLKESKVEV